MFNLKKQKLVYLVASLSFLLFLSSSIPSLRAPLLNISRLPLTLISLVRREAGGIIFYHRNFIQNEKLNNQVNLLRQRLISIQDISLENARLKKLLEFKQKSPYKVIAARVIARSPDNWSSIIFIDKGSQYGIKAGMTAISYLGLIGRVTQVSKYISKILLANDPDFAVSAIVQRSRQEGLVSGSLGSFLLMKYLPSDADVRIQDIVITSGLTPVFPKGLIIGSVTEVAEEFSGLSRYCLIKPAVSLSSLEEVLVIVQ